ncbi:phosphoglycolate phosphatase [Jannaschia pagri]|uniref:phosphoglycolate phosphatase n=1 Tax=Jannaschia pagri TaxID=2829797 RepID=A0ABQ4NQN1_9RHOB|nr:MULTISPECIES: HAD family hydrolase [unclassified Jannaschia]GIT92883.1 phosphoglycolate phosphatase [Jannaschia sp. AI_61]GIT96718.1 phosphoglycolate phosphatase [Jannaschia sp. AI_62]
MKRSVIFDLDGTLCDTSGDLLAAANVALARLDRPERLDPARTEDKATALRGGRAMLRLALSRSGPVDETLVDAGYRPLLEAYGAAIAEHTEFYPGARDAVARLRDRGDGVAICTNKPEGLAVNLMAELGATDLFDALVGADTLPVRKPDPAPLVEAVRRIGGDMGRTVLIGDTETDRKTSAAAGVPSILVTFAPGGMDVAGLHPEALLDHFDQLEDALSVVGL